MRYRHSKAAQEIDGLPEWCEDLECELPHEMVSELEL